MVEFPSSMPIDAFLIVINKIRGKQEVGNLEFSKALWNIVGYAASEAISDDKTIFEEADTSPEAFASILEQVVAESESIKEPGDRLKNIPWATILKVGLKLLLTIFLL